MSVDIYLTVYTIHCQVSQLNRCLYLLSVFTDSLYNKLVHIQYMYTNPTPLYPHVCSVVGLYVWRGGSKSTHPCLIDRDRHPGYQIDPRYSHGHLTPYSQPAIGFTCPGG